MVTTESFAQSVGSLCGKAVKVAGTPCPWPKRFAGHVVPIWRPFAETNVGMAKAVCRALPSFLVNQNMTSHWLCWRVWWPTKILDWPT